MSWLITREQVIEIRYATLFLFYNGNMLGVWSLNSEADMGAILQPTLEVTEDEFDKVFAVNVKSIFHSSQVVIPQFLKQGDGGSIINIASIGATRPRPGLVWYNASKAAVTNVRCPLIRPHPQISPN